MKIALVGRYGEGEIATGPERVARELFIEFKNKNIHVVFIEYFFSGYKESSIFKKLFGKKYFENKTIRRLGLFPLLFTFLQNKFDIVHVVNSQRFNLFLLILKNIISGKLVATFHGLVHNEIPKNLYLQKRYFLDFWVERLLVKKSDLIIFPSEILYDAFNKNYNISDKKYQIIPNGISKIFFNKDSSFPRIKDSIKIIFYSGFNDSIERGLSYLLQGLANVKFNIELFVIGSKIKVDIPSTNIKLTFVALMNHTELILFLRDKHFIIKSHSFDTFSNIVIECMTLGIIPIISENTGTKEFIKQGSNGFIYDGSSSSELSVLINDIYETKYDLKQISNNAKKIYEKLNWENIANEYFAAYNKIL